MPNRIIAIFIFITLLTAGTLSLAAAGLEIQAVRQGGGEGKTRIVIDFNKKTTFDAFLLDAPPRLAVDVPAATWKTYKNRALQDDILKSYRSGLLKDKGKTRIIFDLRKPAVIDSAFVLPKTTMAKDRLVIDLKPASAALFTARSQDKTQNKIPAKSSAVPAPPKVYTVVLDAGHGGDDPGAIGAGNIREKNITLAIARELGHQMEETGRYRVVFTRINDHYITLRDRVLLSRREKADLFISIHADKIDRRGVQGASIYTLSEKASDSETERLAETENNAGIVAGVDLAEESADVADILLDLAMREKMNESNFLAQVTEMSLRRKGIRLLPNAHRSAGFAVLKAPDVPAILVETGFLSNGEEARLLSTASFQRKIAAALVDGVDAYFEKMESLNKK